MSVMIVTSLWRRSALSRASRLEIAGSGPSTSWTKCRSVMISAPVMPACAFRALDSLTISISAR